MIYRGPSFLASYNLAPPPPPPIPVNKVDWRHTVRSRKKDNLLTGEGRRGAKLYNGEIAWFTINNSILSDYGLMAYGILLQSQPLESAFYLCGENFITF
jgi:hypothetical protein